MEELWELFRDFQELTDTNLMLGILSLVDITLVENLLTVVVIGGYATFVSKLNLERHTDKPDWLSDINPASIKVKLATALIGVSSIHLLKVFVNVSQVPPEEIKWRILIHLSFLGTAIFLAWTDRIMQKPVPPKQPVLLA